MRRAAVEQVPTDLCIDTLQGAPDAPLGVLACQRAMQGSQYLTLSLAHELRDEDACAELQLNRLYQATYVRHRYIKSQLCLDSGLQGGADLLAKPCSGANTQQWVIDYTEDNDFKVT
ncbi:Glycosyl transferase, partial [Operophtera brumata]